MFEEEQGSNIAPARLRFVEARQLSLSSFLIISAFQDEVAARAFGGQAAANELQMDSLEDLVESLIADEPTDVGISMFMSPEDEDEEEDIEMSPIDGGSDAFQKKDVPGQAAAPGAPQPRALPQMGFGNNADVELQLHNERCAYLTLPNTECK